MNGAVIIEGREIPDIRKIVKNHLKHLPEWECIFFHSAINKKFIKKQLRNLEINFIELPVEINLENYNKLLCSASFWENLSYDKILIFQSDSKILRFGIDKFMEWDYVGAPWAFQEHGGNGGLSLRTRQVMINICKTHQNTDFQNEDTWFCNIMHNERIGKLAPREICQKFSCESIFELKTFGYHGINNWLTPEQCEIIKNQCK